MAMQSGVSSRFGWPNLAGGMVLLLGAQALLVSVAQAQEPPSREVEPW